MFNSIIDKGEPKLNPLNHYIKKISIIFTLPLVAWFDVFKFIESEDINLNGVDTI